MGSQSIKTIWILTGLVTVVGCQAASQKRVAADAVSPSRRAVEPAPIATSSSLVARDNRTQDTPAALSSAANIALVSHETMEPGSTPLIPTAQGSDSVSPVEIEANAFTPVAAEPSDGHQAWSLTLHQAIETALLQNPDMVALRQAEGVSVAALGVAETYPFNPFLQVQATPAQDGPHGEAGTTYHYVLLMQQIQLAHQQSHREAIAAAQLNSVRWNIIQAELQTVAQAEQLYFTAVYQQGLRDLAAANAANNQQLLVILEKQLDAGQVTAADVAIVRLDARSTNQQLRLAEANLETALLDLRRFLAVDLHLPLHLQTEGLLPADSPSELAKKESPLPWKVIENEDSAIARLAARRPDVMAACADTDAARANTRLAKASRVPDVQLGPYYQRTLDGSTFFGFRAHSELPVWNNGNPLVRQRYAETRQRAVTYDQIRTRAEIEAEVAVDRYDRAVRLLSDSDMTESLQLPAELERLEAQVAEGEVDVLRVFQARTSLLQNRRAVLDSLNELMQASAAVTAATGLPLESMLALPGPSPWHVETLCLPK